jgi:hypothetical protein
MREPPAPFFIGENHHWIGIFRHKDDIENT